MRRRKQNRLSNRAPELLVRPGVGRLPVPVRQQNGANYRDRCRYVSQHAARQAAVGAAGLSRYDRGKHSVERVSGRSGAVPFDARRYRNWRFFWDYSGGNVYENMCHQVSFWYKVLGLQIPSAVTMTGGLYLWLDGREVPDTMTVSMQQPEDLLFTWTPGLATRAGRYGERSGDGRNHRERRADPLHAGKSEPPAR